ncbi:hypothetical protein HMPREF1548_01431 [Clostridium sp. KLE 1755]|nr:hypothetical protein HMPREF1548_01431 [Clostridium sp. KLE 1755]
MVLLKKTACIRVQKEFVRQAVFFQYLKHKKRMFSRLEKHPLYFTVLKSVPWHTLLYILAHEKNKV